LTPVQPGQATWETWFLGKRAFPPLRLASPLLVGHKEHRSYRLVLSILPLVNCYPLASIIPVKHPL
jgi:hypothetical protein